MSDAILIRGLTIHARIGVPESERAHPQRLELDAEILTGVPFRELGDEIARTVDYDAVCRRLREVAASSSWRLLETLACEMAEAVLRDFPARSVTVEIRKFLLPGVEWIAVRHSASKD